MEKIITINEQEIRLSNNNEWLFIYNDQFGHDIVETIMPVLSAGFQAIGAVIEEVGGEKSIDIRDVMKAYNSGAMQDAIIYLMSLRMTDLIAITWAMAKASDPSIKPPRSWAKDLGEFPIDEVVPVIVELLISGMVSSKNRERLRTMLTSLRPQA